MTPKPDNKERIARLEKAVLFIARLLIEKAIISPNYGRQIERILKGEVDG